MMSSRRSLLSAGLLLAVPACRWSPAERGAKKPPLVALVMKSLANEFFVTMESGARAHQQAHPDRYRLLANGIRNESNLAEQVSIIDQMVAAGAKALVVAPADSKAIVPAVIRAQKAGVVVVNIDSRLDPAVLREYGATVPFVGPDNREGATRVGEVVARMLKPGDEVAILEGITTADNSVQRRTGLVDAATAAKLSIVTVQSAEWDQAKAATIAAAILIRYPNLKALLCANDNMALGAASAVSQAGRAGKVLISGFDNVSAIRSLITSGQVVATADQHGSELAVFGIDFALAALGGQVNFTDRKTPVDIVDAATLGRSR